MTNPVPRSRLIQPNTQAPVFVDPVTGTVQLAPASSVAVAGVQTPALAIVEELKAPGVLYTVPSGKTFYGVLVITAAGANAGTVTVTDASSVVWANEPGGDTAPVVPRIVPVTIPGASGNALTVAVTASAAVLSVLLAGYVH